MSTTQQSTAVVMLGKPVADEINARLTREVPEFTAKHKIVPNLAIVQVGNNAASERYIKKKIEACAKLHMCAELKAFPDDITADDLKGEVDRISRSRDFHGVLVQLPLPREIEEHHTAGTNKFDIFDVISAEKDVDGVGHDAIASLYRAQPDRMIMLPGTALAVRRIMAFYKVQTEGKTAVIVGRNDITSKPMMLMLGGRMCNAAAIWVHRHIAIEDQKKLIRQADIIVTAVGSTAYRITADMVKPGAAIFDVATRIDSHGKMHGDVDFEAVQHIASHITPVPRGVGPVTVAALTENLFRAAKFAAGVGEYGYKF
ncbi:MAG: bifunctional 5,10-methylenetetrahydrofolate dehydrogenase/5,10-methenyltetrahydrofolate cyclohydrolase [Terriglobales bacterium]